ncbi:MAG: Ig-like domain-containing protein [bacterium]
MPQAATVATVLTPSVIVTDGSGNPLPNYQVSFAVTSGAGSVSPVATQTDENGRASTQWTLGPNAGQQSVAATAGAQTVPFTVIGTAGVATQIAAIPGGDGQTAAPGTAVSTPPSVVVRDSHGNPKAGVAVTFAVAAGGGSVTGEATTTNASGIATVGSWTLGSVAQTYTLTATSPGLTGSPVTFTATVVAVGGTLAVNGGNNQSATVNTSVVVAPSVVVRDQNNNPIVGASVRFAATAGAGTVTGATTQTNASGVATVGSWTLGVTAGANTLTATSASGSVTFNATGIAAAAATLAINTGTAQVTTSGTPVATPPSVVVRDEYGNPVSGVSVTFAVVSGGGSVTGSPAITNALGVATAGSWTLGSAAGANTLTATVSGLTPVTFTATGTAGTGAMSVNAGDSQTATVNTAVVIPPSVIIKDANGNPVGGVGVTFAVTTGGGTVTGGTTTTSASGIATVGGWTLGTTAGANTLSATSTLGSATFTATGIAGAASQIALNSGDNQTAVAGTATTFSPSVIVKDAFNNRKGGVQVTFTVTSGGGSVTSAVVTSAQDGIARVGRWILGTTVGPNTLTATSPGLTGSPVTFTATAVTGAATITANAGDNQTATVFTTVAIAPSVFVKDNNNNPISGQSVTFAVASGNGTITGATTTTNASGIATVGSWTLGGTAGANTLTATSAGSIGSPVTFTATGTADVAQTMTLNGGSGQTAGAGTAVPTPPSVLIKDQYNNAVSGAAVTFTVASGGGSVTGGTATTNASGIATVGSWTLGNTPGANTLTAMSTSVAGVTITFTATGTVGPAATIAPIGGNGQSATAGSAVAMNPSVLVTDVAGNPVSGVSVTFAVASGGGSATGVAAVTDGSGIAMVGSWTLGTTAGSNTLVASSGSLTGSPVTFTATGVAGPAASISVNAGNGQTATAGTAVATPPSVIVKDANGNPVAGVTITFGVTSGGGSATGLTVDTDSNGIATVGSWTLGAIAGSNTLTATSASVSGGLATFTATGQ